MPDIATSAEIERHSESIGASDTDRNADLFVKLYSKMALALGVTPASMKQADLNEVDPELLSLFDGKAPPRPSRILAPGANREAQYLLAIYNPGQYIPAQMDPVSNVDDRYALSVLFDVVPQFSWVFKPASTTVSNSYRSILDYKEAPLTHLTPEQLAKLEEANATYDKYEKEYDEYLEKYLVALDEYDAALATYQNDKSKPVPPSARLRLKRAYDQWVAHHKEAVESAVAVMAQYEALEPSAFWYKMLDRFKVGTQRTSMDNEFQVMGFSPPYKSWFEKAGWTSFTFTQKDMDNQRKSDAIGVAGQLDGQFGIIKLSGSGDYHQDSSYVKIDQVDLTFSCELMRVSLDRFWMNPLIFSSKAWRWAKGTPTYGMEFSTGADIEGDIAPEGTMTVIPTAAILSRNLRVTGKFEDTLVQELNRKIAAEASVGIGPFAISGKFNMEQHEGSEKGTIATNGMEANDVQIVALICEVLPKSPNPDNSLPW